MLSKLARHRNSAYINQSGRCYYCNFPMWENDPESYAKTHNIKSSLAKFFQCTAEHLEARSDGGKNNAKNIVAACIWCNQKRHSRKNAPSPIEYRQLVQNRLSKGRWFCKELLVQFSKVVQMTQ